MKLKLGKVFKGKGSAPAADIMTVAAAPLAGDTGMADERLRSRLAPCRWSSSCVQLPVAAKAVRQLPLIGHLSTAKQFQYLAAALATSFVLMLILFGLYAIEAQKRRPERGDRNANAARRPRGAALTVRNGWWAGLMYCSRAASSSATISRPSPLGEYRGVSVSEPQSETVRTAVTDLEKALDALLMAKSTNWFAARAILTSLSQAVSNVNQGNQGLLEPAEQLATQLSSGSGREIALANNS